MTEELKVCPICYGKGIILTWDYQDCEEEKLCPECKEVGEKVKVLEKKIVVYKLLSEIDKTMREKLHAHLTRIKDWRRVAANLEAKVGVMELRLDTKEEELKAEREKVREAMERLAELNLYSSGLHARLTSIKEATGPVIKEFETHYRNRYSGYHNKKIVRMDFPVGYLRKLREVVEDKKIVTYTCGCKGISTQPKGDPR